MAPLSWHGADGLDTQQGLQSCLSGGPPPAATAPSTRPGGGPCCAAGTPSLLANAPLSLQVRTADMGGYATSLDFTQAVIAALDV